MIVELVLLGALLALLWVSFFKKPAGLPPGKWGLPGIGYLPLPLKNPELVVTELREKFGDVFVWRMGTQVVVFLHNYQLVKEAYNRPEIQDRPPWDTFRFREPMVLGLIGTNDQRWHNNRRFTLRQLRDLGMGKSKLVEAVHTQAIQLVQELKKQAGQPSQLLHALNVAVVNIIWQMVGNKQFGFDDPKLKEFEALINNLLFNLNYIAIPDFFPWLHSVLPAFLLARICRYDAMDNARDMMVNFFNEEVEKHQNTLDQDNPRDLIDGYLIEMEKRKNDPDNTFNVRDLDLLLLDLFFAGTETTSSSLAWLIYYLATFPEIQKKVQKEIESVLPDGTLATMADKSRMPYMEAVIHETLRKSSLSAFGGLHTTSRNTTLGGYTLPKGTILCSSNSMIHHNSSYWHRPNQFLPERWLDQDGNFNSKKDGFLPFSVGKRQCVGENLARMELFIFSTTLLQNLSFSIPPGKTLNLEPLPGNPFIHVPIPQDLIITGK